MRWIVRAISVAALGLATTELAWAQSTDFHKPLSPIGPTSEQQCQALSSDWAQVCQRINDAHSQCLMGYEGSDVKSAGECSRAPCLNLHQQMTSCGGPEQTEQVNACYVQVRSFRAREAEFRRAQIEALEAQRRAEQARREALEADARRHTADADASRRRADEYRRRLKGRADESRLDDAQAGKLDQLRERAADTALAASNSFARGVQAVASVDFSHVNASALDLLRNEGREVLLEGLGDFESTDWVPETYDLLSQAADGGQWMSDVYQTFRDAPNDWGGTFDRLRALADVPIAIPNLRVITARHAIDTGGRLKDGYRSALERLDVFLGNAASDSSTARDPFDDMTRDIVGQFLPLDRIERWKRATDDATYTWQSAKDQLFRFFNP